MAGTLEPPEAQSVLDYWPPTHHPDSLVCQRRNGYALPILAQSRPDLLGTYDQRDPARTVSSFVFSCGLDFSSPLLGPQHSSLVLHRTKGPGPWHLSPSGFFQVGVHRSAGSGTLALGCLSASLRIWTFFARPGEDGVGVAERPIKGPLPSGVLILLWGIAGARLRVAQSPLPRLARRTLVGRRLLCLLLLPENPGLCLAFPQ